MNYNIAIVEDNPLSYFSPAGVNYNPQLDVAIKEFKTTEENVHIYGQTFVEVNSKIDLGFLGDVFKTQDLGKDWDLFHFYIWNATAKQVVSELNKELLNKN